jgi:hypothetical protein
VQLHTDKPVLVLSVSAGAALAVGLLAGFVLVEGMSDSPVGVVVGSLLMVFLQSF